MYLSSVTVGSIIISSPYSQTNVSQKVRKRMQQCVCVTLQKKFVNNLFQQKYIIHYHTNITFSSAKYITVYLYI